MKYKSLESKIKSLWEKKVESDQNDQVAVGSYTTKAFEMCKDAQQLYSNLPKDINPNDAEQAAINLDKLFGLEKRVVSQERSSEGDVHTAEQLAARVMKSAKSMNLSKEHEAITNRHLGIIKKYLKPDSNVVSSEKSFHPADDKRFQTPPKGQVPDPQGGPQGDRDIDNVKKYLISRSQKAQRKIKIIDND